MSWMTANLHRHITHEVELDAEQEVELIHNLKVGGSIPGFQSILVQVAQFTGV